MRRTGLDTHGATHDGLGRGIVPLRCAGDFDVVFTQAFGQCFKALQRSCKSFRLKVFEADALRFECIH